ncbi:hypothetical protein A1O3_10406 [Capronia epimyces CBS 606.96]|uniref:BRCT domain-containing protein n=1 Tax=Capronia epimyces CBS 606.96 TaxID=1182542 RepID=W9XAH4_9EURO|nr:uncharacterized protein A1O3_10406 [Capronia epimyces CBS 606.96]EXJ77248.1 hypothetical protein A1O3_10406 [Capronia epimyces CBS 606.96]
MRPPPLPLVTRFQVGELEEEDLKDSLHEKADTCLTVSPGQSTTSTFCPSPSPGKQRDQTNISTEGTGASEYLSSQPEDLPPTEEIIGVEDKEHIMQTEPESHSDEEPGREGPAPSIESVEELASTAKGPEGCHTSEQDADTAVEALSSAVSIPPTQDLPHGTTPSPSDWLTKKRKFVHNEETDLQVDNSYGQLRTAQRDVVGDTIEVWTRSRRKATMLAHKSPSPVAPTKTTSPATFSRSQTQDPDEMGSGRRGAQDKSPPQSTVGPPAREDVGRVPVVVFSNTNIQENKTIMRSFASLGGRVTTSINKATILVVGDGPLKKTGKLIMAVSIGLDVATEQWIVETVNKGQTQNIRQFLPKDPSREQQWGFNLGQAIDRGKRGLTHLLAGTTVFFTKQLKRELGSLDREISQIATILGAEAVKHRLPALKNKGQYKEKELLIIGAPQDPQGAHAGRLGQKLFSKDILTMGALRGEIDRESSESILEVPVKDEENN